MLIDALRNNVQVERLKNKRIIMYGASTRNQNAIEELGIKENVLFFVDSNEEKAGGVLGEYEICSSTVLQEYTDCIILSVLVGYLEEVMMILDNNGIKAKNCLFYYPEFFNIEEVLLSNIETLEKKKNYKYIHVFSNDKFVIPFYLMLEERFPIEEHLFIVAYRIKGDYAGILQFLMQKCKKYHNILILDDVHGIFNKNIHSSARLIPEDLDCNQVFYSEMLKKVCFNAYKIFFHSAIWGNETKKFISILTMYCFQKIIWICFGGDAYFDKNSFEVTQILSKIRFCPGSNGIYEVVKQNYGIYRKIDGEAYYVYIPQYMIKQVPIHDSANILLGHSAFKYGNHMEGMEILKKYVDEDIKIYCPLSYGSESYRKEVIQKGEAMFGNKFIPLLSYMEQAQYLEFLQSIDVAVFPLKRLAAESTFLLLKAFHVKIYADIGVIEHISDRFLHIEDIRKIQSETLEEFIASIKQESYGISDLNNYVVDEWTRILEVE